jgi:hypothetical protein
VHGLSGAIVPNVKRNSKSYSDATAYVTGSSRVYY